MIGITGGIGSGKSLVSRILRLQGYPVYDCDTEAKRIMDTSEEVLLALNERFGDTVCPKRGPIYRDQLSKHVFGNDSHRLWLNELVHRLVKEDLMIWEKNQTAERCFVESAILVSSGLAELCREIWMVYAPENIRIERAMKRDHSSLDKIRQRIRSQEEEERLTRLAGITIIKIDNSGIQPIIPLISSTAAGVNTL